MIKQTVRQIGTKIERLTKKDIPLSRCFEIISRRADSVEEAIVIEVMREVVNDMRTDMQSHLGKLAS